MPFLLTRSSRSRTASVTAAVMLSPVSCASSCASRCVSSFLILRLMVEFYHNDKVFYQREKVSTAGQHSLHPTPQTPHLPPTSAQHRFFAARKARNSMS